MSPRGVVLAICALVVAPALAGCAADEPAATERSEPVRPGGTSSGSGAPTTTQPAPVPVRGTSERWHFHDYWKGNPTITLFDGNVSLNVTIGPDGLPAIGSIFELPQGVIVPPETGFLTFNATWAEPLHGVVNLTVKPADSNEFQPAGDLENGVPIALATTESNCDVPHRQLSAWKFNVTAKPAGTPPEPPARDIRLNITATIGRPLFIDPPHLNWWRSGDIIPLVSEAAGEIRAVRTSATNVTLPGLPPDPASPPAPASATQTYTVPVDEGRIVPEGAKSVVVMINWTTQMPQGKLAVRFSENNYPSEGPLELAAEEGTSRIYTLKIAQAQTDTTYSNRTTWAFRIVPEGEPAGAFEGSFTLVAWATRLDPKAAVAAITAPA